MYRTIALAAALALMGASTAAARPAAETTKKLDGNAVISFQGVGPIKLRMGINEARKAAHRGIIEGEEVTKGCRVDTVLPKRFGLQMLRFNKKIRVLYVTRTAMPTAKGIRVNDTLNRLRSKYGSRLQERASDVSPETRIFELHGKGTREMQFSVNAEDKIFQIATGLRPEVDFSEGCA
jgi:hypothetical protein